jgi:hypothetical protein
MHQVSRDKMVGWRLSASPFGGVSMRRTTPFCQASACSKTLFIITTRHPSPENYGQYMTHNVLDVRAEEIKSESLC